jgi:hypothetical protein
MSKSIKSTVAPGNFISEWFGHRIYPQVADDPVMLIDQSNQRCPFLSLATGEDQECVKAPSSKGVCMISSIGNKQRRDWLVCPYRALDQELLQNCIHRLYKIPQDTRALILPAPTLKKETVRQAITNALKINRPVFVFFQDKLGGEISISGTDRSPELSFDITFVEISSDSDKIDVGKYGILEVQTMDYHGTYRHAVQNLQDALRLHRTGFPQALQEHQEWLSESVEGPNIANVFKRTFYQMMFKFQLGIDPDCAGCVLAIPGSVWDSWQRHLGKPVLIAHQEGTYTLSRPKEVPEINTEKTEEDTPVEIQDVIKDPAPAWVYVFETDTKAPRSPNPIIIEKVITTDAASFSYFALQVAPEAAIQTSISSLGTTLRRRLRTYWQIFNV